MKPRIKATPLTLRAIGAILFLTLNSVEASCKYPNYLDPDDMFDHIGREDSCDEYTENHRGGSRADTSIINFATGWLSSGDSASTEAGRAVVVSPTGSLFVAGRYNGGNNDFLVNKYSPDGSYDTSFFTNGRGIYNLNTDDFAHGIVLQSDGRVVVVGRSDNDGAGLFNFAAIRLTLNGSLDTTFFTTGKRYVTFGNSTDIGRAIALQTDGKMVLVGYAKGTDFDFAFARLLTDGGLDTTFSTDGKYTLGALSSDDGATSVTIDFSGTIVAAGPAFTGTRWDWGFIRVLTSGSIDTTFHTDGKMTMSLSGGGGGSASQAVYSIVSDPTGRYVAGGGGNHDANDWGWSTAVIRLQTSGSFDTAFNTNGRYFNDLASSNDDGINGVTLGTDGLTIYAAGFIFGLSDSNLLLLKFKSDGVLDTSFQSDGYTTNALYSADDIAQAIAMNGDGIIYVVGRTNDATSYEVAVARYDYKGDLALSGSVDLYFNGSGSIAYNMGVVGAEIAAQTDGKTVHALGGFAGGVHGLVRRLPNATLDTSFATDGNYLTDFTGNGGAGNLSLWIQSDGAIVSAGSDSPDGFAFDFCVARWTTDGQLDTAFSTNGYDIQNDDGGADSDRGYRLFQHTDGTFSTAQLRSNNQATRRYLSSGAVDTSFNTAGYKYIPLTAGSSWGVRVQSNGMPLLLGMGTLAGVSTNQDGVITRMLTDGTLDTSFQTRGQGFYHTVTNDRLYDLDFVADGKYVAVGSDGTTDLLIIRVRTDGTLDSSFRTDGTGSDNSSGADRLFAVKALPGDKIVASGRNAANAFDFVIARYLTNGSLDTAFNTSGINTTDPSGGGADVDAYITVLPNGKYCVGGSSAALAGISCFWP